MGQGAADKRQPIGRKRRGREVPLVRQMPFIQDRRMKHRDAKLQVFYDLTETAILRRANTCKNARPAAKPVFDALRKNAGGQGSFTPQRVPAYGALESALLIESTGPAPIPQLVAALRELAPSLSWERRNASPPDATNFHDGHANALVAGPGGLEEREDVWVGISLLAPRVRYPDHRHHPEEVYVSLAGGAWWNANMDWTTPPGGPYLQRAQCAPRHAYRSAAAARHLVPVGG
jgi:hypothetical protein